MKKTEKYQQYRNETAIEMLKDEPVYLFRCEAEFLEAMMHMPEKAAFLDDEVSKKLEAYCANTDSVSLYTLAEHKKTAVWEDEEYIKKVRTVMEIVRNKEAFSYQSTVASGKVYRGTGYPISIKVDKFTHTWYLHFIDMEKEDSVLARIDRLEIGGRFSDKALSDEEVRQILEKRHTGYVEIKVSNKRSAIQRAASDFCMQKRKMHYDKETGEMDMKIYFYDFEEEDIIGKILSLGCYAKVIEPERLKWRIQQIINAAISNYQASLE